MKFIVFAILFYATVCNSTANELSFLPVNYEEIEKNISDSTSQYFYPPLLERYVNSDTTLTVEELRHVYYGYSFSDEYDPLILSEELDSVQFYMSKPYFSNNDFEQIIKFGELHLKKFPFDTYAISYLFHAYERIGNIEMRDKLTLRLFSIVDAIMSTGNGVEFNYPLHVIYIQHEYLILEIMELQFSGEQTLADEFIDYLEVQPNDREIRGMYFDMRQSMKTLRRLYDKIIEPK